MEALQLPQIRGLHRRRTPSDVLFLEHPSQRTLVVGEELADALVAHLLVCKLVGEVLVLLADLGFGSHALS